MILRATDLANADDMAGVGATDATNVSSTAHHLLQFVVRKIAQSLLVQRELLWFIFHGGKESPLRGCRLRNRAARVIIFPKRNIIVEDL